MELTKPKISIITCFLNAGLYLEEAIQSVLAQEYTKWELLLIDDGSSDNSSSIAKDYAYRYPGKIVYLEHEGHQNKGSSASRNWGIEKSTGVLIAFLDADDVWLPQLLNNLLALMQEHKVSLVCEATEYWYSWNDETAKDYILQIGAPQDQVFLPPHLMLELYPLADGAAPCICGMLLKKDKLNKWGNFDAAFEGMYDDQVLLTKFYLNEPVYISSGCSNRYRQHPDSMVKTSWRTDYKEVRYKFLKWLEIYLLQQNIRYPKVNRLLKKALMPYRHRLRFVVLYQLPYLGRVIISKIKRKIRAKAKAIGINARA